jgi:hypothetical protein
VSDERDRTMLPELLPRPAPAPALTPQERVAERARQLLQRFRGLGATAGAAVLGLHCSGYEVVDPLPPPPTQCSTAVDPFAGWTASASTESSGLLPRVRLEIRTSYPRYVGFEVGEVRVAGGSVVRVDLGEFVTELGDRFIILIAPANENIRALTVDVDLACGSTTGSLRYAIDYQPVRDRPLPVQRERSPLDAAVNPDDAGTRD